MRRRASAGNLILLALGAAGLGSALTRPFQAAKLDFSRDVLPILSDKCFKCHGPDAGSRMAGLRLDTPDGAFADRGGRWAIVPGKPADSLLVQRINHPDTPMPPPGSGKSLTKSEIATLTKWIEEGATYGKHWAFVALPPKIPVPDAGKGWARDDLDRFIFARLQREGLKPTSEASRERWLRRVSFDLTGLPPTAEEVADFLGDKGPKAYERVADRLLGSPHFGERMAVDWLDAARYSDSYGYQSDLLMPTWPYRDWVVRAFNENKPYDRFLTEQIAGDLLPNATRDQRLATAFNRLHRQSNEGGSIPADFKNEYAVDRVSTFGTAVLGLTLGCARCHDHKFDPIKQREFYQLYAYFNSIDEFGLLLSTEIVPTPSLLLPTPEQEKRLVDLREQNARALAKLDETSAGPSAKGKPLLRFPLEELPAGDGKAPFATAGPGVKLVPGVKGMAFQLDGENAIVVRGTTARERWDPFSWAFWVRDPRNKGETVLLHRTGGTDVGFCGFDLVLENGHLTARIYRHWPGNAVAVRTLDSLPKGKWAHVGWSWDGNGRAKGLKLYLGGEPARTEVLADKLWKKVNAYGDLGIGQGNWTFGARFRDAGFKGGEIDEIAYADRTLAAADFAALAKFSTEEPGVDSALEAAREEVRKAQRELTVFEEGIREISVMEDAKSPVPAYVLARGQYDSPKSEENRVGRGVPAVLPPLPPAEKNDRLALARWSTQADHPLTARVAVNRIWQMLFGNGLVETSENFGIQGSQPSHPELLDFLARRFVDSGWDVKALVRKVVLSATYRQDSAATKATREKDPSNRFLSRGPSTRLSAEMIRDLALSASGLLNDKMGGPPVNPYQPAGIWSENNTMSPPFVQSKGRDLYRRSLYSTWKRTTPVPSMLVFDANSREACTVRRPSTNTPLQALVLLNDVQFVEACRALAELAIRSETGDEGRLGAAFLRLAGRPPMPKELAILSETLAEQRAYFRGHLSDAAKLIAIGDSKPDPKLRPSDLAAMTVAVQTILNSDAAIWKR